MKKRELKIGELVPRTRLRVLGLEPSDSHGNQRVRVQCEWYVRGKLCGKIKVMRATAMTIKPYEDRNGKLRLPHRSCGCQSWLAHQLYWEKRAKGMRRLIQQKIFRGRYRYRESFQKLAKEFKMPVSLVTTIFRLYAAKYKRAHPEPVRRRAREEWPGRAREEWPDWLK
jgi:hypothetical protein